jgi:hypothetical protein
MDNTRDIGELAATYVDGVAGAEISSRSMATVMLYLSAGEGVRIMLP